MIFRMDALIRPRSGLFLIFALCIAFDAIAAYEDEYIAEAQNSCFQKHDTLSCFKFRTLRYMSGVARGEIWPLDTNGTARFDSSRTFNLVHIKDTETTDDSGFFDETRQMKNDSEFDKFIKFTKRQLEMYMSSHGITFGLPEGATTIPFEDYASNEVARSAEFKEARGKKKKLAMLVPLLSLFSLFKVKILLIPILLTVLFIKKVIVLATLFIPSILATLKVCKMQNAAGHGHGQWAAPEASVDYGSGYGNGYPAPYSGGGSAYAKDWGASRAYNSYNPNSAYKTISDMTYGATNTNLYAAGPTTH